MRARLAILLSLAGLAAAGTAQAQGFAIQRGVVSGGAVAAMGGQYRLSASAGQPVVGLAAGAADTRCSGFWCGAGLVPTAVPDQPVIWAGLRSFLLGNHPNPFNPFTTISFRVAGGEAVDLAVHDLAGRHVRTLWRGILPAGDQAFTWDGTDEAGRTVGSGVFLARLKVGALTESRRMTIVK